jgi:hypothetical protein
MRLVWGFFSGLGLAMMALPALARPGDADSPLVVPGFPFVHATTTAGHASRIERYGCAPTILQGGPEVAYAVTLERAGELVASVSGVSGVVDVDVHILGSTNTDREGVAHACFARGNTVVQATLQSGTYFVTVDTVDNAARAGPYVLRIDFQPVDAWYERALAKGVTLRTRRYASLNGNVQFTGVLQVDPNEPTAFVRPVTTDVCTPLPALGRAAGAVAGVNGGLFDDTTCTSRSFVKLDGAVLARGEPVARTAFGVSAGERAAVELVPVDGAFDAAEHALGGLPRIITSGAVDLRTAEEGGSTLLADSFDARTVGAALSGGGIAFATVDGRTAASAGLPLRALAEWLLGLDVGVHDAVSLDGGPSTTLWAMGEPHDGIVNYPTRGRANHLNARPIHTAWLVFGAPLELPPRFLTEPAQSPATAGIAYVYEAVAADPAATPVRFSADATVLSGRLTIADRGDGSARYEYVPSPLEVARSPITLTFVAEGAAGRRATQSILLEVRALDGDAGVSFVDAGAPDAGSADAGAFEDAGVEPDAGASEDAGAVQDAGSSAPTRTDAGLVRDAGLGVGLADAGAPLPKGGAGCASAGVRAVAFDKRGFLCLLVLALAVARGRRRVESRGR